VIVTITTETPTPEQPESPINNIIAPQAGDPSAWLLSPIGLGIVIGFIALFVIMAAILIKNNKTVKEINQRIGKPSASKIDSKKTMR
jgi:hypothetical protein